MKHSQVIGIITAIVMIVFCFFPWSYIASQHLTITGFSAPGTTYGKPGLLTTILCVIMIALFAIPAIWAKRINVFFAAFALAWSFRNFLLISACMMGECPEKRPALIVLLLLAGVTMLMALLPKISVKN